MATEDVKDDVIPTTITEPRTKRKRWGERPAAVVETLQRPTPSGSGNATSTTDTTTTNTNTTTNQLSGGNSTSTTTNDGKLDPKAKVLAMQESIRARLAAAKAAQQQQQQQPPPPPPTQLPLYTSNMTAAAASGLFKRPFSMIESSTSSTQSQSQPQPHQQQFAAAETVVTKKAKIYDVDMTVTAPTFNDSTIQRNESKHDTATTTTSKKTSSKEATTINLATHVKPSNPYLSHLSTGDSEILEDDTDDTTAIDPQLLRTSKVRKRHKEFHFIEPGTYSEIASTKRERESKAIASGYLSGRKIGHTIVAPTVASVVVNNGDNTINAVSSMNHEMDDDDDDIATLVPRPEYDDTSMPIALEWWDMELLPSKLKKEVAAAENKLLLEQTTKKTKLMKSDMDVTTLVEEELVDLRQRCYAQASYSYSKTTTLVQHIVPVQPTNLVQAQQNQKQMVLHLTKKELKRQRKLRRQGQQREQQDLQAAGILPAPEPRLTLRNFIQVLGDQAYLDPSQIEQKVQEQMMARQRTHLERNEAARLTKEQRSAKLARKYEEDTTASVTTAIFYVKDMSHPYHRTKVDLNAQQLNLSGCVVECTQDPSFACVIVEGGPKAIKRYTRLMVVRMKWTGPDNGINAYDDDDDDDVDDMDANGDMDATMRHRFNPNNVCQVIWQGLSIKRLFHGFIFQACATLEQGRKICKTKGAAHYWDQVVQHATSFGHPSSSSSILKLKLYNDDEDADADDNNGDDKIMTEMN